MQRLLRLIYPPTCVSCEALVEEARGLCGACWRETPFIAGLACDLCGTPLPGEAGGIEHCDDCLTIARPWAKGRAALLYKDNGRRVVLALKHGDRLDLAIPAARWMAAAGRHILTPGALLVPVPVHWLRLARRRYNQSAVLAQALARQTGLKVLPDGLVRTRRTPVQDGMGRDERFRNLQDAIQPHPRRARILQGREVILIDDVMTSGATLAAATEAAHAAGATRVSMLALARVAKDA
ncbi:MAG: ComF family protein [Rhodobacteraceae bacterium]|nr:ComF family protein [Paracoccaceae bacterium]